MADELITTGFEELNKYLRDIKVGAKPALRKAFRVAMRPVQAAAKEFAPKASGAMAASIKIRAGKRSRDRVVIRVTTGTKTIKTDRFYSAFNNWGWKPGAFPGNQGNEQEEATNFMGDAVDSTSPQIEPVLVREIGQFLKSEIKG